MPNFREQLADQAERKLYTAIEDEDTSSASRDWPVSPTTDRQSEQEAQYPSDPNVDHGDSETKSAEQQVITEPQSRSPHESELGPQRVDWRVSWLDALIDPSRDLRWSEEEGDKIFDRGCEEWRKQSLAALEGFDDLSRSHGAAASPLQDQDSKLPTGHQSNQYDHSSASISSEASHSGDQQVLVDSDSNLASENSRIFAPEPSWVKDYNERPRTTPRTPGQSSYNDGVQIYEPYSPEKLESPPKMRFDHERDLLDLPEMDQQATQLSSDPAQQSYMAVLQSPERLLFLPEEDDTGRTQDIHSAASFVSASRTSLVADASTALEHTPADRNHEQAPSDGDDNVGDFGTLENMLFVSILRAIFAAEGGLAALPEVLLFDDDDVDEDVEDEISELELNDCD